MAVRWRTDLPRLSSILFDNGAFMEFSIFTVKTLPELTDLIIGSDENEFSSYSFYCSKECVIADLASLQTLELGASSFFTTQKLELSNLPSLISLSVAAGAFSKLTTLNLRELPNLASLSIGSGCMNGLHRFQIDSRDEAVVSRRHGVTRASDGGVGVVQKRS